MSTSGSQTRKGVKDHGHFKTKHRRTVSLRLSKCLIEHPVKNRRNGLQGQTTCNRTISLIEKLGSVFQRKPYYVLQAALLICPQEPLLPESSMIIHSVKLMFGVLESSHSLLQPWMHRGEFHPIVRANKTILLYIYTTFRFILMILPGTY